MLGYGETYQLPLLQSVTELLHHDDRQRLQADWDAALDIGDPYELTARMVREDGSIGKGLGHGRTTQDDSGVVTHLFGRFQLIDDGKASAQN